MQMIPPSRRLGALAVLILAIGILFTGCTVQQGNGENTTSTGKGVIDITQNAVPASINLSEANAGFREWAGIRFSPSEDEDRTLPGNISLPENASSTLQIHSVQGIGLSANSSARIWLFGIRAGNDSFLAEYRAGTWSLRDLPGTLPPESLNISEVVQPSELLEKNPAVAGDIFSANATVVDLLLEGGTYSLSSKTSTFYRTWTFDAKNGSVIALP